MSALDQVFLSDAMEGFSTLLTSINAFSWAAKNENATLGDTITVPYLSNKSGSAAFSYATGYTGNYNSIEGKDVTLSTLLYQPTDIDDASMSKLTAESLSRLANTMGQALARDVISASLAATITDANFATSASISANELTSSIGLSTLVQQADTLNWTSNRSMILAPLAWSYLLRNPDVNQAFAYGNGDPIQKGTVSNVYGFTPSKYTGTMPKADLKGIVCDPSAIIVGLGVHAPSKDSAGLVSVEQASANCLVLQSKRWYSPDYARTRFVIECLFGCTIGNRTGLVQLK